MPGLLSLLTTGKGGKSPVPSLRFLLPGPITSLVEKPLPVEYGTKEDMDKDKYEEYLKVMEEKRLADIEDAKKNRTVRRVVPGSPPGPPIYEDIKIPKGPGYPPGPPPGSY